MGVWRRTASFKFGDEDRANLLAIHEALAPMHENLSQTLRWILKIMHMLIFTRGMLGELATMIQGFPRSTVQHTVPVEGRKPRRQVQRIAR
jgi:hypothetical protein